MRILTAAALLGLVLAGAACAGGAARPSHTAAAGVVRRDGRIVLQKPGEAYRPTGLWTALYTFPDRRVVRSIRLEGLAVPNGCDVFTQYRWRDPHGEWQGWSPTNLLRNGDFADGAPKGAKLHKGKAKPGEPTRWASKPARASDKLARFWEAVVPPGADLTFAASVATAEEDADGYPALAARLRDAADKPLATVEAMSFGDRRTGAWRRLAVGMVTPPAARGFDGGARVVPAKATPDKPAQTTLRAAEGILVFREPPAKPTVLFRGDVSNPEKWKVHKGPVSWPQGERGGLRMSPDMERDVVPTARVGPREKIALEEADWIEVRANVAVEDAAVHVSIALTAEGREQSGVLWLACRAVDGDYRFRGSRSVPKWATHAELIIYAFPADGKKKGTVTVHELEVRPAGAARTPAARPPPGPRARAPSPSPFSSHPRGMCI
ncbi:MAG: hypothetical protein R6V58_11045 [Planctomycetota bacterium]